MTLAAVAPTLWLTWRRGGVEAAGPALAFGWILLLTAVCAAIPPRGIAVSVPWPAAAIAILPFWQVIPFGWRSTAPSGVLYPELQKALATLGAQAPSTISLYPLGTLRVAALIVGCCALYCLIRSLVRAQSSAAFLALALLAGLGLAEAARGVQQYLHAQYFSLDEAAGVTAFARGTMVNRNHFAALLEGCFGASVGLLLAYGFRRQQGAPLPKRGTILVAGATISLMACIVGLVLSFSRMGILVLCLAAATALVFAVRRGKPRGRALLALLCVFPVAICISIGIEDLPARFQQLIIERGDPGRSAIWGDTIRSAQDHLWTGTGLGSFPFAFRRSAMYLPRKTIDHAHNDYLEMLLEVGVPGTLLVAGTLVFCSLTSVRRLRRVQDARRRGLAVGCLLGAGAILLHATADFPLRIPALAALVATLLGCASGLTDQPNLQALPMVRRVAVALAFALAAGILLAGLKFGPMDPEESFANGQRAFLAGDLAEASRHWRDVLTGNAYAAPVWMRLAELAEARGEAKQAARYAHIAETLEPRSFRISWPAAELFLRHGNSAEAVRRFAEIARSLPEMRPAIYYSCWAGGVQPDAIATAIVPQEGLAVGEYLVFLIRSGQWTQIVPAYERLATNPPLEIPGGLMQYVLDRLLQAGRESEMNALAKLVRGKARPSLAVAEAGSILPVGAPARAPQ